jgi:serine/threonine protein kinase
MALTSGTKLGPYEIVALLGAGGMGEVYRARDTRLQRTVAIKILSAHLSQNAAAKERFDREARAISSLNHPNICHLYDVGQQDGIRYLVMEYLEGETLADRLHRGPLSLEQVLTYGMDICEGLEKAHRTQVIHRDLKPGNIMLTKSGAKLMDFGLAKPAAAVMKASSSSALPTMTQPLTAEGTVVGTFQYMSPEQLEGAEADAQSDIFSLGAVLYEMVTGRRAFEGKTAASTVAAILAVEPQSVSIFQPMSPAALDRVITGCLTKDPDERLQAVHDVRLQLKWIAEGRSQVSVLEPVTSHRKMIERLAWAAAVLAVTTIALAIAFMLSKPAPLQPLRLSASIGVDASLSTDLGPSAVLSPNGTGLVPTTRSASIFARSSSCKRHPFPRPTTPPTPSFRLMASGWRSSLMAN